MNDLTLADGLSMKRQQAMSEFVCQTFIPTVEAEGFRFDDLIAALTDYIRSKTQLEELFFTEMLEALTDCARHRSGWSEIISLLETTSSLVTQVMNASEPNT
jgi:hypothetical protein